MGAARSGAELEDPRAARWENIPAGPVGRCRARRVRVGRARTRPRVVQGSLFGSQADAASLKLSSGYFSSRNLLRVCCVLGGSVTSKEFKIGKLEMIRLSSQNSVEPREMLFSPLTSGAEKWLFYKRSASR